ncbi:MAG: BON domain-containing protein [Gammaproteobacteria bacterium]|nr:BON domain-containing protein [Gammaproteobacteria bacterium]
MSDREVARAVESELQYSDIIPFSRVWIAVDDGIVSLTGSVSTLTAFEQAEDIAATVRGVRGIVNRIDVVAPDTEPSVLEQRVAAALAGNSATDQYEITIDASDAGIVTLDGTVDSWAERSLAETVTGTVRGVRSIQNRIAVDTSRVHRGPGEIDAEIDERLHWDARVDDSLIEILVRDGGRVTLSGTVGSLAEKRLAVELAHVAGVQTVDATHLEVEPWAQDDELRLGAARDASDAEIERAIDKALAVDPRVAREDIDVIVTDNRAWLQGTVSTLTAWRAAESNARNTVGVEQTFNHLRVEPLMLADEELAARATDALTSNDALAQHEIWIRADNGRVRVVGDVDNAEQYWLADELIANLRGVEEFVNDLTIRGEQPRFAGDAYMETPRLLLPRARASYDVLSDRTLHEAVESELFWSPFVDENEVGIDVENGRVTLTGTVDSINEYVAATDNAFEAGAEIVRNQLEIE